MSPKRRVSASIHCSPTLRYFFFARNELNTQQERQKRNITAPVSPQCLQHAQERQRFFNAFWWLVLFCSWKRCRLLITRCDCLFHWTLAFPAIFSSSHLKWGGIHLLFLNTKFVVVTKLLDSLTIQGLIRLFTPSKIYIRNSKRKNRSIHIKFNFAFTKRKRKMKKRETLALRYNTGKSWIILFERAAPRSWRARHVSCKSTCN